jgi:uncharacterized protein (TIGR03435 family)
MEPAYALVVAKSGPKLTPAPQGERTVLAEANNTITAKAVSIDQLIHSPFMASQEIVDRTGLTGQYDFTLTYSERMPEEGATDAPPPLAQAVQEQLGLKLEPTKAPVEYIVIDRIEQPTEN